MREQPEAVLKGLKQAVLRNHRIVVTIITYTKMCFGATGPEDSSRHIELVDALCTHPGAVLPWDRDTVAASMDITVGWPQPGCRSAPTRFPLPGNATTASSVLVTSNFRKFEANAGLGAGKQG